MATLRADARLTLVCDPEADKDPLSRATHRARAHGGQPWTLTLKPANLGYSRWEPTDDVGPDVFALTRQEVSSENPRYAGQSEVWHYSITCPVCETHISASHDVLGPLLEHAEKSGDDLPLLVVAGVLEEARRLQSEALLDRESRRLERINSRVSQE